MSALKSIIKITKSDYDTLASIGSIVKNSVTYNYNPHEVLYIVDNGLSDQYVQLGGGGGKLLSQFATSDNISDLANRISVEATNRSNADSSITVALANETNARKATDPVFINMFSYLTLGAAVSVVDFNTLALYIQNKKNIIGYVSTTTSNMDVFYINALYKIIITTNGITPVSIRIITLVFIYDGLIYYIIINNKINATTTYTVTTCKAITFISNNSILSYSDSSTGITLCNTQLMWNQLNTMTTYYYSSTGAVTINLSHNSKHRICILAVGGNQVNINLPSNNLINGETFQIYCTCYTTTSSTCTWYIYTNNNKYFYYNGTQTGGYYYKVSTTSNKIFTCVYNINVSAWQLFF